MSFEEIKDVYLCEVQYLANNSYGVFAMSAKMSDGQQIGEIKRDLNAIQKK